MHHAANQAALRANLSVDPYDLGVQEQASGA